MKPMNSKFWSRSLVHSVYATHKFENDGITHHVEGEADHLLLPPDGCYHHQVEKDTDHGQGHVHHHHQGS